MYGGTTFERGDELVAIARALDDAAVGNGRVIVIEGVAGIGKTHLVRAARDLAKERGFGRLQAMGDELETSMAWGVVRQMVERSISRYAGEVREAILAGPTGRALGALAEAPTSASTGDDGDLARTLHALWWVAVDLSATRPLLITVDDAQWSDLPSLRFLAYLARRLADLPIALVVGTRPPPDSAAPLVELSVAHSTVRLLPGPLGLDSVGELCGQRGPVVPEVVAAVHASSGGNPFLAEALLDELSSRKAALDDPATAVQVASLGPAAVSRTMLARLSGDGSRLASAAAVLGASSDPWLAATVAGLDPTAIPAAVQSLVDGHVVVDGAERLEFVHPVVREAVLSTLRAVERGELHAQAALALFGRRTPADRVAVHLAAAPRGTIPEAARIFRDAAAISRAAGDSATAAAHLERAFEENPADAEVEAELGLALMRAGETARARTHLRAAAADSDVRRAQLLGAAATATSILDGPAAAVHELSRHLDAWPDAGRDPARLALEARRAAIRHFVTEERAAAGAHLKTFSDLPGETADERTLLALLAQSGRFDGTSHDEVAAVAIRALSDGRLFRDALASSETMAAWVVAVMALTAADRVVEARAEIDRALHVVRRDGSPLDYAMVANCGLFLAWRLGDVAGADVHAAAAREATDSWDLTPHVVAIRATAAMLGAYVAFEQRDRPRARALVADFDAESAGTPSQVQTLWMHEVRARIALGSDEPERALAEAFALRDAMTAAHLETPQIPWRVPAAFAAQRLGQDQLAVDLAEEQLAVARTWGAPTDVGAALRLVARVARSEVADRIATLTDAISVLESAPNRLELAKALLHLGEALRVARQRSEARDVLVRSADLAHDCGSADVRLEAVNALEALGDRPRRFVTVGSDSLTASERRVADLAVGGRSNRDIAQELFVSPKTVENHLGRIYTKLGITGRRELAGALS